MPKKKDVFAVGDQIYYVDNNLVVGGVVTAVNEDMYTIAGGLSTSDVYKTEKLAQEQIDARV